VDPKSDKSVLRRSRQGTKPDGTHKEDASAVRDAESEDSNLDLTATGGAAPNEDKGADVIRSVWSRQQAIPFPAGLMRLDLSSNMSIVNDPCGKQLFDAVKVNRWVVRLDTRATEIGEHYVKAIAAVVSNNKEQSEMSK